MAALDDFDRTAAAVLALASGLTADDLARPTPCEAWNVRALINHLVFGNRLLADVLQGGQLPPRDELMRAREIDRLGDDPQRTFQSSIEEFRAAARRPEVADQTFPTPVGPLPADGVVHLRVIELLVHGWDLARGLDRPAALPDDLAEQTLRLWREQDRVNPIPRQAGGQFAAEQPVPDDAPAIDRLAGLFGRPVG